MIVNSYNGEFGYELISVLPYAYYLHSKGKLSGTISGYDTESLYYFSPNHIINPDRRSWYNVAKMDTPNKDIHKRKLDVSKFLPPPYKEEYANFYDFDCVVCNRYNAEWPGRPGLNRPINYFSFEHLDKIFSSGKKIAYLNLHGFDKHYDNADALEMNDYDFCSQYGNVYHIRDLVEDSLNETQLKVMASASEFHTLNGGYSILASYFGGTNYIYTKKTIDKGSVYPRELETGDFNYYPLFGGSAIKLREL